LIATAEDINKALADQAIKARLQSVLDRLLPEEAPKMILMATKITFLENNRLQAKIELQQPMEDSEPPETINLVVETGLKIVKGKSLEFVEPTAILNDRKISSRILNSMIGLVSDRLDVSSFEQQGIMARVLKLKITPQQIDIAAFIRLNPLNKENSVSLR
ncbi:MAG: LmeA family phospholipid-binding protein, partial [Microcystaceae cyanobacterium]